MFALCERRGYRSVSEMLGPDGLSPDEMQMWQAFYAVQARRKEG